MILHTRWQTRGFPEEGEREAGGEGGAAGAVDRAPPPNCEFTVPKG